MPTHHMSILLAHGFGCEPCKLVSQDIKTQMNACRSNQTSIDFAQGGPSRSLNPELESVQAPTFLLQCEEKEKKQEKTIK